MKKNLLFLLIHFSVSYFTNAQDFEVDTIQYSGDVDTFINIVILGDGYTASQQNNFINDAENLSDYLFIQQPYSNYKNYFNVFAVKVISEQSGASHPNSASDCHTNSPLVPTSNPNTYLGCSFDMYGIHRLLVPNNTLHVASALGNNFPNYDQVLIISNSPYYGGSGGEYASSTIHAASGEIVVHELGHSFGNLADEYYAGDVYSTEKPNMTQQTNSNLVKWSNWVDTDGIGINQHCCGGNSASWYKPHTNCRMEYLGYPFCNVCREALIEKIHSLTDPIVRYSPTTSNLTTSNQMMEFKLSELMKPIPNTLKSTWTLDGTTIYNNLDSITINFSNVSNGNHLLSVSVTDTSEMLRVENHSNLHISSVNWNITKSNVGFELLSSANEYSFTIFPNPASHVLTISIESKTQGEVSIQLISQDGKVIEILEDQPFINGKYCNSISIEHLPNASYFIRYNLNGITYSQTFIKG